MATDADVVALINQQGERLAIWHIVIDPSWPMSRLSGAWVDIVAPHLYFRRFLLPYGDQMPADLAHLVADSAGVIDANATRDAVATEIAALNTRHQNSPTKAGKPRAGISWPRIPDPLDWNNLPAPPLGVVADPLMRDTIAVARWLSQIADAWSSVETTRLSRDYLSDGESTPRPMPVIV